MLAKFYNQKSKITKENILHTAGGIILLVFSYFWLHLQYGTWVNTIFTPFDAYATGARPETGLVPTINNFFEANEWLVILLFSVFVIINVVVLSYNLYQKQSNYPFLFTAVANFIYSLLIPIYPILYLPFYYFFGIDISGKFISLSQYFLNMTFFFVITGFVLYIQFKYPNRGDLKHACDKILNPIKTKLHFNINLEFLVNVFKNCAIMFAFFGVIKTLIPYLSSIMIDADMINKITVNSLPITIAAVILSFFKLKNLKHSLFTFFIVLIISSYLFLLPMKLPIRDPGYIVILGVFPLSFIVGGYLIELFYRKRSEMFY